MTTIAVMAFLIALYAAVSLYVRKATEYLELSSAPWDRLHAAAKEVIADQTMPQPAAVFAAAAVLCAGCGCLTRQILVDAFTGRLHRKLDGPLPEHKLTPEQMSVFARVVVNAIHYDSLRAPFSGFILRRLVMPWLCDAAENPPMPSQTQVAHIVASSKTAIAHKLEGKKLLAMA